MASEAMTPEIERQFAGGLLHRPEQLPEIELPPAALSQEAYRQTYSAIVSLNEQRKPIDVISVAEWLEREGMRDPIPFLSRMMQDWIETQSPQSSARKIKEAYSERKVREIARELAENSDQDSVDKAIKRLTDLTTTKADRDQSISSAVSGFLSHVDTLSQQEGLSGISTGIASVDRVLGGHQNSDLGIVGARTGMGKTAYLVNNSLAANVPLGIISAEQPATQIAGRLIAVHGRIHAARLRNGKLRDEEWRRLTHTAAAVSKLGIHIDDTPAPSIAHVGRRARIWKHRHGIKILFVDYLQRLTGTDRRAPRFEQVSEIAMGLKELARELQIPVVALAQVGRQAEQRQDKRPGLSDMRESGSIEMEADTVLTLYRPELHSNSPVDKNIVEIEILKNRHGPTGFVRARWEAEFMRFSDLEDSK